MIQPKPQRTSVIVKSFLERRDGNRKKRLDEAYITQLETFLKGYRHKAGVCGQCGKDHVEAPGAVYGDVCGDLALVCAPLEFKEVDRKKQRRGGR